MADFAKSNQNTVNKSILISCIVQENIIMMRLWHQHEQCFLKSEHIYPEHVVDEIHQAPEEERRAIDCIFLWCFICESDNQSKKIKKKNVLLNMAHSVQYNQTQICKQILM